MALTYDFVVKNERNSLGRLVAIVTEAIIPKCTDELRMLNSQNMRCNILLVLTKFECGAAKGPGAIANYYFLGCFVDF